MQAIWEAPRHKPHAGPESVTLSAGAPKFARESSTELDMGAPTQERK